MNNKGQSLIEVVVALVITGLIALGIVKATTTSLKNGNFAKSQTEAVTAAQRQITEVKRQIFFSGNTFWDKNDPADPFVLPNEVTEYTLTSDYYCLESEVMNTGTIGMAEVQVTVYWDEKNDSADCRAGYVNYNHQQTLSTYVAKPS